MGAPEKKRRRFLRRIFGLKHGTDVGGTIDSINRSASISGAGLWMLVLSAAIASIGLDLNSGPVIIGAMLISPLMSPILGVGLGAAILDRRLLRKATWNLGLATVLSLGVSWLYFLVSPLGVLTPELSARTTPTILDVGVAFFGGTAGIIAGSRKDATAAIPGVAIATALMPPICTAGYGLATRDTTIFLGAFYLYFINAFFISLATYLIALFLRFPSRTRADESDKTTVKMLVAGFAIIVTIPSMLIFYRVIRQLRLDQGAKSFVNERIRSDERQPVRWQIDPSGAHPVLKVYMVGNPANSDENERLQEEMKGYGLAGIGLKMVSMNVSPAEFKRLSTTVNGGLSDKLAVVLGMQDTQAAELAALRDELDALRRSSDPESAFAADIEGRFETVEKVAIGPIREAEARSIEISFKVGTRPEEKAAVAEEIGKLASERWPGVIFKTAERTGGDDRAADKDAE